ELHRNLSLIGICLLVAHIVTTILDPFAQITVRDAIIPVGAVYRPVWLGLGVVAMEIMAALIVTSLLRERVGLRLWRLIHWVSYLSWPLAVVHGLGTGSDSRAPWMIAVVASCVEAVILALYQRLRYGPIQTLPIRAGGAVLAVFSVVVMGVWAVTGPFQLDWTSRSGTPVKVAAVTGPVHPGPGGFSDPLYGTIAKDSAGNIAISFRDAVDTALTVSVRSPNSNETLPVVTVARGSKVLCTVPATTGVTLYTVCGKVAIEITFYGSTTLVTTGGSIQGRLDTSGPLN
ncbi:MAG TPA: ferric reductase-like transmembrane domain-containing protein, partial [Patescibacteria group bacterium]|nr:ferric reductase-like transmembrane domain-containing protein [Patescibacteria group bacterium]